MTRLAHRAVVVALVVACSSCAHDPRLPRAPLPAVAWPGPPDPPRIRLVGLFPDPSAPLPRRSFFRAVLDTLAGVDASTRRAAAPLARPFGVAALAGGAFLVADPDRPAVLRVGADGKYTAIECRDRAWRAPMAAVPGPAGDTWVADGGAGEVVRVGKDGTCRSIGGGALERPTGLAVAADRLFVVDPPRHAVVVLAPTGEEIARWGSRGDGDGQLHFPTSLAFARDGSLLVVDALNFRIVRFSIEGAWLGAFGDLERPKGVAVDDEGRVYVADAQRDVVLRYHPDGTLDVELGVGGGEPGHFTMPAGVSVAEGRLFVADSHNQRVQVFEILGGRP